MNASTSLTLKIAAACGIGIAALAASTSTASAHDGDAWGYRHGHGYGHGHVRRSVACVAPVRVYAPTIVYRHAYAPGRYFVPRPAFVAPYPYVAAPPLPYGAVVYDPVHVHVGGFVGFSGPHVSIGIGF